MATSCPHCIQNFEDAGKTKGVENLRVMDVSELVANSLARKE
jgi:Fe-S oxidoreductase